MRTARLVPLWLAASLACGDPASSANDAAARPDAAATRDAAPTEQDAAVAPDPDGAESPPDAAEPMADAGPTFADAEAPCARNDAGNCALLTWTPTTAFPVAVDHHTAFVATSTSGNFLHVVGGVRNTRDTLHEVYSAVRRAEILADGQLGAWEESIPLPAPQAFHAQVSHNGFVYLLAGITSDPMGPAASVSVRYGRIDGGGAVRRWDTATRLPTVARLHASAAVAGDRLYMIGGSSQDVLATVNFAQINADGSLGAWSDGPTLPVPRSHHASVSWGGRVYLVGGFTTGQARAQPILRSTHGGDGAITGWEQVGDMPQTPWTHGAFVRNDFIYVVGGGEGSGFTSRYVNRVRRAAIDADGVVGAFEDVAAPLPRARSHVHHAPYFRDHVYSVGGRREPTLTSLAEITIATFR